MIKYHNTAKMINKFKTNKKFKMNNYKINKINKMINPKLIIIKKLIIQYNP